MDHKSLDADEPMLELQEKLLEKLKNKMIISDGGEK